jgi:hypothetical protein
VIIIKDDQAKQTDVAQQTTLVLKTDAQLLAEKSNFDQWRDFLFDN